MDTLQPCGDRHAAKLLWCSLAESYAEVGCELHINFRAGFVNGGIASDWCAVFNRTEDWLDLVGSEAFNPEGEGGVLKSVMWGKRCLSSTASLLSCQRWSLVALFHRLYGCNPSIIAFASGWTPLSISSSFAEFSASKIGNPDFPSILLGNGAPLLAKASSKARLSSAERRLCIQSPMMTLSSAAGGGLRTSTQRSFFVLSKSSGSLQV